VHKIFAGNLKIRDLGANEEINGCSWRRVRGVVDWINLAHNELWWWMAVTIWGGEFIGQLCNN